MVYNLRPKIKVKHDSRTWKNYTQIADEISQQFVNGKRTLALECYPGVNLHEIEELLLSKLKGVRLIKADDYAYDAETITNKIAANLTDDRVFGLMSHATLDEFFPNYEIRQIKKEIAEESRNIVVYGTGATILLPNPDILCYADLTRWEIQKRYRAGMPNWKAANESEDNLKKVKRGFFFEWRVADRLKQKVTDRLDYLLDTNVSCQAKMVDGVSYRNALDQIVKQPFRLVPYFDASVWGGQWMKKEFNLNPEMENYGWAFDGVPEENSLCLDFSGVAIEIPAINVVHQRPIPLLGKKVQARFGNEFPIRFDYLDTVGGGNLSLQVHPRVDYIQDKFGMFYTQNESYYILQASEKSTIYLGVKEGTEKAELFKELRKAEKGDYRFPDEKFINCFPVNKHDHYSIPAGTIHCGGPETVVLEISQTPYIFTFKLWDWERLGLDGLPRPVHLNHGEENVNTAYDTKWVQENLINPFETLHEDNESRVEKTGLHELEFIETHRHWFKKEVTVKVHQSVNMLNLVEGETITVESLDNSFDPFEVHYGETFIVPEAVKEYKLVNQGNQEKEVAVIQAFVRNFS
ncbi:MULTISPECIES: class I mannose-6-phosphate isomerase [Enterococcus]|uniref:Mannose-6-phosphate isomerase n=1 Tax=Enterococcus gallinarum TaxID=1353 RepID=A0A2K3QVY5_ENTGA|nr:MULTISPECIES: class I mannose-6-phosphate isomerase [Enterococcus]MBF0822459.1 class I mannose-6-phosphate isomerase [Enterococcus faecalis]MBA0947774.1 class I mannose-6-phosphate isomerase [Enterococcus gallinarum]MBA0960818.1 class I mannose-6-phosphate isomerase [Enterococcus gallinarum]MBA0968842.1 class I mannose-6-phosphate isomerase [Enterococcus gallinarum]MBA0972128.1 class I mannose-6-phosphate isomerase [Enterococcus gallinarum]